MSLAITRTANRALRHTKRKCPAAGKSRKRPTRKMGALKKNCLKRAGLGDLTTGDSWARRLVYTYEHLCLSLSLSRVARLFCFVFNLSIYRSESSGRPSPDQPAPPPQKRRRRMCVCVLRVSFILSLFFLFCFVLPSSLVHNSPASSQYSDAAASVCVIGALSQGQQRRSDQCHSFGHCLRAVSRGKRQLTLAGRHCVNIDRSSNAR